MVFVLKFTRMASPETCRYLPQAFPVLAIMVSEVHHSRSLDRASTAPSEAGPQTRYYRDVVRATSWGSIDLCLLGSKPLHLYPISHLVTYSPVRSLVVSAALVVCSMAGIGVALFSG